MHTKSLTKCLTLTMSTTRGCTDGALRMWTAMRYQFAIPIQKVQLSGWTWRSRSVELGNLMWWQTQLLPSPSTCTSSTWRRSWLYRHMLKKPWQGRKKGCKSWVRAQSCVCAKSMFVSWERLGGRFDSIAIWNRSETQKHVGDLTMKWNACMDDMKLYETSNLTHSTFELKLQTSTVKLLEAPWHFPCQHCHFGFVSEAPDCSLDLLLPCQCHHISSTWSTSFVRSLASACACPVHFPCFPHFWMSFLAMHSSRLTVSKFGMWNLSSRLRINNLLETLESLEFRI